MLFVVIINKNIVVIMYNFPLIISKVAATFVDASKLEKNI